MTAISPYMWGSPPSLRQWATIKALSFQRRHRTEQRSPEAHPLLLGQKLTQRLRGKRGTRKRCWALQCVQTLSEVAGSPYRPSENRFGHGMLNFLDVSAKLSSYNQSLSV